MLNFPLMESRRATSARIVLGLGFRMMSDEALTVVLEMVYGQPMWTTRGYPVGECVMGHLRSSGGARSQSMVMVMPMSLYEVLRRAPVLPAHFGPPCSMHRQPAQRWGAEADWRQRRGYRSGMHCGDVVR